MITVKISGQFESTLLDIATQRSCTVKDLVDEIINKFLPTLHIIDSEAMASGYADMGDININISEGELD